MGRIDPIDVMAVLGLLSVVGGLAMVHLALAFVGLGALILGFALLAARGR